jgi:transglutaminase-like putative cysteine protease
VTTYTRTFAIRYLMRYQYESPVIDNLNALRVTPATSGAQICEDVQVLVAPEARLHRHNDYYGTSVLEFGVERPHSELTIDVRSHVRTDLPPLAPEASWAPTESDGYCEAGAEYLLAGEDRLPPGDLDDLIRHTRATTPLATVRLVCELIPDRFEYRAGATYVGSNVADLLRAGAGVCQDFVHLALLLLREQGIAARYVSGYLWVAPEDGSTDSAEVQTHAWLEALVPANGGSGDPVWVGADPTNRGLVGSDHVKIGHGRRYSDVPPIKGVYRGVAETHSDAKVEMRRLDV